MRARCEHVDRELYIHAYIHTHIHTYIRILTHAGTQQACIPRAQARGHDRYASNIQRRAYLSFERTPPDLFEYKYILFPHVDETCSGNSNRRAFLDFF
jgi:hypothetical protein